MPLEKFRASFKKVKNASFKHFLHHEPRCSTESAIELPVLLHAADTAADVSIVAQLLLVDAGDSSDGVKTCVYSGFFHFMSGLLAPYTVQDFPEHLEQTQQMEFNAPKTQRHLITATQAAMLKVVFG